MLEVGSKDILSKNDVDGIKVRSKGERLVPS